MSAARILLAVNGCAAAGLLWLLGCSTATPPTTPDGGTTEAGIRLPGEAGAADSDESCLDEPAASQCEQCCATFHPEGNKAYNDAFDSCLCGDGGACQEPCATTQCAATQTQADDACDGCIRSATGTDGGCSEPISKGCGTNADCALLYRCLNACASK